MAFQKGNNLGKGRPKGAKNKQTIAREEARKRVLEADATPLDVLSAGMRHHYEQWQKNSATDDLAAAVEYAAKAAPYVHPRLASTDSSVTHDVADPLMELLHQIDGRTRSVPPVRQPRVASEQPVHHNGQAGE